MTVLERGVPAGASHRPETLISGSWLPRFEREDLVVDGENRAHLGMRCAAIVLQTLRVDGESRSVMTDPFLRRKVLRTKLHARVLRNHA
ncbi:hypothetical protein Z045_19620 [Rhodococcus pyridinivorans KG-16]|uniref:Uncharacterized protein n=1 Tax=Rhodococcus pyridinivorans KG-16 TaxID=1441730 RepID=A0A0V9UG69_9NOCA|nr:hypothetical protein Z045_19620 [Rhodococcus pyridinivorans KG-16]